MTETDPGPGEETEEFDEEKSRRAINRDLGRAKSALQTIRSFYVGLAFLTAIVLAAWYLPSAGRALSQIGLVLLLCQIALYITGAVRTYKEPVLWSFLAALLNTGLVLMVFTAGPHSWLFRIVLSAILVGMWSMVPLAHRASRHLVDFPDLRMARRFRGEVLAEAGHTTRESRRRTRRSTRSSLHNAVIFGGGSAAFVLLAVFLIFRGDRPVDVQPTLHAFRDSWNGTQLDEVSELFPEDRRDSLDQRFRSWIRRRGWQEALPPLTEVEVESDSSTKVAATFLMGEDTLETRWEWQNRRWNLRMFARRVAAGGED